MKIHAAAFANLLGIQTVQGGFFHKLGNFSRYGFAHIFKHSSPDLADGPACEDVNDYNVRLYTDKSRKFLRDKEFQPLVDWRTQETFRYASAAVRTGCKEPLCFFSSREKIGRANVEPLGH
jgi:hypothetical protein